MSFNNKPLLNRSTNIIYFLLFIHTLTMDLGKSLTGMLIQSYDVKKIPDVFCFFQHLQEKRPKFLITYEKHYSISIIKPAWTY